MGVLRSAGRTPHLSAILLQPLGGWTRWTTDELDQLLLLAGASSSLEPSSQQLLEFPGHVRCLAFDARHLLPPLECLNLPDTGIQFSANAQLREAVQRRLAGGSRLQRKNDVMEISLLAGRPSNVLNFQLDKQLLQYLDKREKQQLRMAFSQAYSL